MRYDLDLIFGRLLAEVEQAVEEDPEGVVQVVFEPGSFLLVHDHVAEIEAPVAGNLFVDPYGKSVLVEGVKDDGLAQAEVDLVGDHEADGAFALAQGDARTHEHTDPVAEQIVSGGLIVDDSFAPALFVAYAEEDGGIVEEADHLQFLVDPVLVCKGGPVFSRGGQPEVSISPRHVHFLLDPIPDAKPHKVKRGISQKFGAPDVEIADHTPLVGEAIGIVDGSPEMSVIVDDLFLLCENGKKAGKDKGSSNQGTDPDWSHGFGVWGKEKKPGKDIRLFSIHFMIKIIDSPVASSVWEREVQACGSPPVFPIIAMPPVLRVQVGGLCPALLLPAFG